jgi:hypothetical protein
MLAVAGVISLILGVARASNIVYDVQFSDYPGGSTVQWLAKKGFEPQRDAVNKNKVTISHSGSALVLETKTRAAALLLSEVNVRTYSKIRIRWGVDAFPHGASYVKGVRSESIMVYVFFGTEKIGSGSIFIPASPYFIGLFLCDSDPVGEAFKGRYFQAGGRYVCIDRARKGEELITEFPIAASFRQFFGQAQAPAISGLGIGIDTESIKGSGAAKSFISEIELIE